MLNWLSQDGKLLLASRALRTFAYGFVSIIIAIYLRQLRFDDLRIGLLLTASLLGGALFTVAVGFIGDKIGRRRTLTLLGVLMVLAGAVFAVTGNYILLLLAALVGTINVTGTEVGPFLSMEQAIIPQTCDSRKRNTAFALYSVVGGLAASTGALFSRLTDFLSGGLGLDQISAFRIMFILYSVAATGSVAVYLLLSSSVELSQKVSPPDEARVRPAAGIIANLAVLFGLDSFAGGFVLQSLVAYWFLIRFGTPLAELSNIFFASSILTSASFLVAGRLADKVGLINTMVFTHLPSNVLLMLVPFAPNQSAAIGIYLARMSLSQMDVPTRQSYVVAIMKPEERALAASVTNVSRNVTQAISPSITGSLLQSAALSSPFLLGGGLKIIYDILLYLKFRSIKPSEERIVEI